MAIELEEKGLLLSCARQLQHGNDEKRLKNISRQKKNKKGVQGVGEKGRDGNLLHCLWGANGQD